METVLDYGQLSAAITTHFRPGVDTNCTLKGETLRREVAAGRLLWHRWSGGLLLLWRRPTCYALYYYRIGRDPLDTALPAGTVVEIPLRPGQEVEIDWWERQGFRLLERRVRLCRPAIGLGGIALMTLEIPPVTAAEALFLLERCFSPLTGCLPTLEELEEDLRCDRILVSGGEGLLRFGGDKVAELRHLAVAPEARGAGVAKGLVARFNVRTADRRARVWTGENNCAALCIYREAGFVPDGWRSLVLTTP